MVFLLHNNSSNNNNILDKIKISQNRTKNIAKEVEEKAQETHIDSETYTFTHRKIPSKQKTHSYTEKYHKNPKQKVIPEGK